MAFKLKSGNKVSFKNMGSSPAKKDEIKSRVKLSEDQKTREHDALYDDVSPGEITPEEKAALRDKELADKYSRYKALEAIGKRERGFNWKKAGMAILQGGGILDAVGAGMGQGRLKSEIIKDKQTKIEGKKERARKKMEWEEKQKEKAKEEADKKRAAAADMNTSSEIQVRQSKYFFDEESV